MEAAERGAGRVPRSHAKYTAGRCTLYPSIGDYTHIQSELSPNTPYTAAHPIVWKCSDNMHALRALCPCSTFFLLVPRPLPLDSEVP